MKVRRLGDIRTTASVAEENVNFDPVPVHSNWGRVAASGVALATTIYLSVWL